MLGLQVAACVHPQVSMARETGGVIRQEKNTQEALALTGGGKPSSGARVALIGASLMRHGHRSLSCFV